MKISLLLLSGVAAVQKAVSAANTFAVKSVENVADYVDAVQDYAFNKAENRAWMVEDNAADELRKARARVKRAKAIADEIIANAGVSRRSASEKIEAIRASVKK